MFVELVAALTLLQEPDSWEAHRPATGAEIARVQFLLKEWAKPWESVLPGFEEHSNLLDPRFFPVVRLEVVTVVESRAYRKSYAGYSGPDLPPPTAGPVDPWTIPGKPVDDFTTQEWKISIPNSESVRDCRVCTSKGTVKCSTCSGDAKIRCSPCSGSGNVTCDKCRGSSRVSCTLCGGSGRTGRRSCSFCVGGSKSCSCSSGKKKCTRCSGAGNSRCSPCGGSGKSKCRECTGKGRIIEAAYILIRHEARGISHTVTDLPAAWMNRVPYTEPITLTGGEIAPFLARIPVVPLRDELSARIAATRSSTENVRIQRVSLRWSGTLRANLEYEGRAYECMAVGSQLFMNGSPLVGRATEKSAEARKKMARGDFEAAKALANEALRLDPGCEDALSVLEYMKQPPRRDPPAPPVVAMPKSSIVWIVVMLGVLVLIGVAIAAALYTWLSIKFGARRT